MTWGILYFFAFINIKDSSLLWRFFLYLQRQWWMFYNLQLAGKLAFGVFLDQAVVQQCYVHCCQWKPWRRQVLGSAWCFSPLCCARWSNSLIFLRKGKITLMVQCEVTKLNLGTCPVKFVLKYLFTKCISPLCLVYSLWKGTTIYTLCSHPFFCSVLF